MVLPTWWIGSLFVLRLGNREQREPQLWVVQCKAWVHCIWFALSVGDGSTWKSSWIWWLTVIREMQRTLHESSENIWQKSAYKFNIVKWAWYDAQENIAFLQGIPTCLRYERLPWLCSCSWYCTLPISSKHSHSSFAIQYFKSIWCPYSFQGGVKANSINCIIFLRVFTGNQINIRA